MRRLDLILISVVSFVFFLQADIAKDSLKKSGTLTVVDTTIANKLFFQADRFSQMGRFDSAINYYAKAASLFRSAGQIDKYAGCMVKISEQYIVAGVMDQARVYADEAFRSSLQHSNMKELGWSYNCFGTIYYYQGKLDSAILLFNKAISTWLKDNGRNEPGLAEAYANTGSIYLVTGNYEEALSFTKKALSITQLLKSNNVSNESSLYANLGSIYYKKGYYNEAAALYEQSVKLALQIYPDTHPLIGTIYNNIGEILNKKGDYTQALIYFQKAASIFRMSVGSKDARVAACYHNIGAIQINTGDFQEGLKSMRVALAIFSGIPGQNISIALLLNSIGRVYREKNNLDSAEFYFRKAISRYLQESHEDPDLAICYSNLGELLGETGQVDQALDNFEKGLKTNEAIFGNKHPNAATIFNNIGKIYYTLGDYYQCIRYMQKSMIANVPEFNDTLITHNPDIKDPFSRFYLSGALETKASAFYELYKKHPESMNLLKTAFSTNNIAAQLLDTMRIDFKAEDSRIFMDKKFLQVYRSGIRYSYLLYRKTGNPEYLEKSFTYSEKSRSAILFSSLKELEARNIGGIPDSLQHFEKNLRLDLAFYTKTIQEEKSRKIPDIKKIQIWQNLQFALNHSYDSLIRSFEQNYPKYYQLKYDLKIVGIDEIRSKLAEKDLLIEYSLADDRLFTFILSKNSVSLISESIDSNFHKNIDLFRRMILHKDISGEAISSYCKVAGSLYETLLRRAEPMLKNKNLIIIPDGKIGTIPFEALLTEKVNGDSLTFKSLPYLIKRNAIGYSYSAAIYIQSIKIDKRSSRKDILAFAPSFKASDPVLLKELKERGEEFVSLAGSKDEVKNIQQLYGGKIFLDTLATKANFLYYSPLYSILHISTHGIMNDEKPMQSKLVFYQKDDSTEDANLYAYEIFNMKLKANLVVLSACNTGFGKIEAGEGIMSLARGFMYAGVPSIISTLWSVNDQSTSIIIKDFYKYLYEKDEKPLALQKAQIDYLNGTDNITAHPYYWSGFISIGNNQPVFSTNNYFKWGIPAFILIIVIYFLFWVKRKKKVKTE
jgi:CHAT domain-containing protein/Tfp pilus assembly protein PilF